MERPKAAAIRIMGLNHSIHHRGQLTAGVTAMGHPGPSLDWAHLLQIEAKQRR